MRAWVTWGTLWKEARSAYPLGGLSVRKVCILWLLLGLLVVLGGGCTTFKRWAYEGFGRDQWQKPDDVIKTLGIRPGDRVADLGSGGGYFTFRLARTVGSAGTVYAVDVDAGLNDYVADRARREGLAHIQVILARYDDPLLPTSGMDLIFTCNTYHHLEDRVSYFQNVRQYLRSGGRVAIVEFNGKHWLNRIFGHQTGADEIRREMEAAGYRLEAQYDFLPRQAFLVFSLQGG